jgi:hypothetical protein
MNITLTTEQVRQITQPAPTVQSCYCPNCEALSKETLMRMLAQAVEAEREACAKVCEARAEEEVGMAYEGIALDCAAAIRARGETK